MKKSTQYVKLFTALSILFLLSSWGSVGHKKINQHCPASLPYTMTFLKANYLLILPAHASDADYRKDSDPTEGPKHYIDIDNYPEFVSSGKIPMSWDSVVNMHGASYVLDQGTLPWATIAAYDTLKACYERKDWTKAGLIAADLGHYVADGHMPLHITANYNGQLSGQTGIHSRYESSMISKYNSQILYEDDSVEVIDNVAGTIFSYIYHNYQFVDSLLYADKMADSIAGSSSGNLYYAELWNRTGTFTTELFKRASFTLAGLIYTAWVEAGSPTMDANAVADYLGDPTTLGPITPNPVHDQCSIPLTIKRSNTHIRLEVINSLGQSCQLVVDSTLQTGTHHFVIPTAQLSQGIYYIVLSEGDSNVVKKMVVSR